jgi:putative endonuclease
MQDQRRFVCILRTQRERDRYYTGLTCDVALRLWAHNAGLSSHTADARPWCEDVVIEFANEKRAAAFEQYLKTGSGRAFAKEHLR